MSKSEHFYPSLLHVNAPKGTSIILQEQIRPHIENL